MVINPSALRAVSTSCWITALLHPLHTTCRRQSSTTSSLGTEACSEWCRLFRRVNQPMFNRCSVEQRTSVTSNGLSMVARFDFEAFRFVQHRDHPKSSIYVHCILRLCEPNKCQELLSVSLKKRLAFGHDVIWEITGNERRHPLSEYQLDYLIIWISIQQLCLFRPAVTGGEELWLLLGDKVQILPLSHLDLFTWPTKVRPNKWTNPPNDWSLFADSVSLPPSENPLAAPYSEYWST